MMDVFRDTTNESYKKVKLKQLFIQQVLSDYLKEVKNTKKTTDSKEPNNNRIKSSYLNNKKIPLELVDIAKIQTKNQTIDFLNINTQIFQSNKKSKSSTAYSKKRTKLNEKKEDSIPVKAILNTINESKKIVKNFNDYNKSSTLKEDFHPDRLKRLFDIGHLKKKYYQMKKQAKSNLLHHNLKEKVLQNMKKKSNFEEEYYEKEITDAIEKKLEEEKKREEEELLKQKKKKFQFKNQATISQYKDNYNTLNKSKSIVNKKIMKTEFSLETDLVLFDTIPVNKQRNIESKLDTNSVSNDNRSEAYFGRNQFNRDFSTTKIEFQKDSKKSSLLKQKPSKFFHKNSFRKEILMTTEDNSKALETLTESAMKENENLNIQLLQNYKKIQKIIEKEKIKHIQCGLLPEKVIEKIINNKKEIKFEKLKRDFSKNIRSKSKIIQLQAKQLTMSSFKNEKQPFYE